MVPGSLAILGRPTNHPRYLRFKERSHSGQTDPVCTTITVRSRSRVPAYHTHRSGEPHLVEKAVAAPRPHKLTAQPKPKSISFSIHPHSVVATRCRARLDRGCAHRHDVLRLLLQQALVAQNARKVLLTHEHTRPAGNGVSTQHAAD